jgi:hypothetical protein
MPRSVREVEFPVAPSCGRRPWVSYILEAEVHVIAGSVTPRGLVNIYLCVLVFWYMGFALHSVMTNETPLMLVDSVAHSLLPDDSRAKAMVPNTGRPVLLSAGSVDDEEQGTRDHGFGGRIPGNITLVGSDSRILTTP